MLVFLYLLKVGIIPLLKNVHLSWKICNTDWSYKIWQFDASQYGHCISAKCYVIISDKLANTSRINKNNILPYGYDIRLNTFFPPDVGVKIEIDYDINLDTKYHVPYTPHSVEIIYSNKNTKKLSPKITYQTPLSRHRNYI